MQQRSILQDHVLVLNRSFLAIQVSTVKDAICALYKGHARVVDENYKLYWFDEWVKKCLDIAKDPDELSKYSGEVRSSSLFIYAPQVLYLPDNDISSPELRTIKFSRRNVFDRDKNQCQYCGKKFHRDNLSMDHVIPRSRGGPSTFTNIVTACKTCNAFKDNKTPDEAGMKLLKKPVAPRWKSHVGTPFSSIKKDYWSLFLKDK